MKLLPTSDFFFFFTVNQHFINHWFIKCCVNFQNKFPESMITLFCTTNSPKLKAIQFTATRDQNIHFREEIWKKSQLQIHQTLLTIQISSYPDVLNYEFNRLINWRHAVIINMGNTTYKLYKGVVPYANSLLKAVLLVLWNGSAVIHQTHSLCEAKPSKRRM